jgi:hypothetical protein
MDIAPTVAIETVSYKNSVISRVDAARVPVRACRKDKVENAELGKHQAPEKPAPIQPPKIPKTTFQTRPPRQTSKIANEHAERPHSPKTGPNRVKIADPSLNKNPIKSRQNPEN